MCLYKKEQEYVALSNKERRTNDMAFTVTKDTVIGDVLDYDSSLAEIFFGIGMHCVG